MDRERRLDVSELEPPEPLVRTLEAAEELGPGEYLRMVHRRDPCLLRDNLDQRGFGHLSRGGDGAPVEVFIWRLGDGEAEAAARAAGGGRP